MANALVLAAGEDHGRLKELSGTPYRALIEVAGKPMAERVLAALRGARRIERIALVAPPAVSQALPRELADVVVEPGATLLDNVILGMSALGNQGAVMFCHPDAPLVTPAAIDDFLEQAEPHEPDVAWAVVPRADVERRFAQGKRTYARLREGEFTGTNVVLVRAEFVAQHHDVIRQFYQHRKSPLRLAAMLGAGFVLRLLAGRVSLADVERRVERLLGGKMRAVVSHYPELAFDVDKAEDLEAIRAILGE